MKEMVWKWMSMSYLFVVVVVVVEVVEAVVDIDEVHRQMTEDVPVFEATTMEVVYHPNLKLQLYDDWKMWRIIYEDGESCLSLLLVVCVESTARQLCLIHFVFVVTLHPNHHHQ